MAVEEKAIGLAVPTYNAGARWRDWLEAIQHQTCRPRRRLIIDSSSNDDTARLAREAGFTVHVIPQEEFDHGGTRQSAVEMLDDVEIIVFLTQDAVCAHPETLATLVAAFGDPEVGGAFGRQLPYPDAAPAEVHARLFNYPPSSHVKALGDVPRLGFRTVFLSNAFAAYRRDALEKVGGFTRSTPTMEDEYIAAKLLLGGFKIAYCAEAQVYHSHAHSFRDEFRRYFDFGAFHAQEPWIRERFGRTGGEGLRFLRSQMAFLRKERPSSIPAAAARTALKLAGFRLGAFERCLPRWLKRRIGLNRGYWDRHG